MVWCAAYSTFFRSLLSPVATGGDLVDLTLQTKLQAPQIETWNTIN